MNRSRAAFLISLSLSMAVVSGVHAQTWTGASSGSWSNVANWSPTGIPASGQNTSLIFGATSNASMTNDIAGTFTLNQMTFNAGDPTYTLTGNALAFQPNSSAVSPSIVMNSANPVSVGDAVTLTNTLTVSGAGNLSLTGAIGGVGGLTMTGSGTVTLGNSPNSYTGGTNVQSGTVQVAADGALGNGNVTGAAFGTLNFTGTTTTTKSFAMNSGTLSVAAGETLTLNGSQVSGTFLDGAGTIATSATNGAQFFSVGSTSSVAIKSNSANDQFVHFDNSAPLTVTAGVNTAGASSVVNFNGFVNEGSGSITIGAGSEINVANFQSYGTLNLTPGGSGQLTLLTNTGTSPLEFAAGSQTFIGIATAPNGHVVAVDLHGQNMLVSGLVVNNGTVGNSVGSGQVIVEYGGTYKGAGNTGGPPIVTQPGGWVEVGSPGAMATGQLVIGPGGIQNFAWQINDARGTAGPTGGPGTLVRGWSQIQANIAPSPLTGQITTGDLTWTATSTPGNQFNLALQTLLAPSPIGGTDVPGAMDSFHAATDNGGSSRAFPGDGDAAFDWPVITFQGTYAGPTDSATLTADTLIDTSGFFNPHPGTFSMQFDAANQSIDLVYTPSAVPEPGTLALTGLASLAAGWVGRRRRAKAAAQ